MRKILLTGASDSFGDAIIDTLLARGDQVYVIGNYSNKAFITKPGYYFFAVNMEDVGMIKESSRNFIKEHKFDLVILNTPEYPDILELDQTSLQTLNEALHRHVWVNKQLIDILDLYSKVRQVVAISSKETSICEKGWGAFVIAKSALNAMIKTYASEKPWTHFSAIDIGTVMTPKLKRIFEKTDAEIYPSIKRLREGYIFTPEVASKRLLLGCELAMEKSSGSFIDMSDLEMTPKLSWLQK